MRPNTPTINTSRTGINVTSPPQTPTTGSPTFTRKTGSGPNGRAGARGEPPHASIIPPLGGVGSQFSSARGIRPEQISPRPSDSSEDDDDDDESELSVSPPQSPLSDVYGVPVGRSYIRTHIVVEATFEIEECTDDDNEDDDDVMESDDDEDEQLEVLQPDDIEYAESERSQSRSRSEREVDPQLMNSFQDMKTCFHSDDESDDLHDEDFMKEIQKWRRMKKEKRMNSGSISKRTISERGSDSDREDLQPWDTGDSNLRRLRRKVDRRSLLSIPPEIIIELKEPNSDGEVVWDEHEINLARELPFWTMEVDVDSD
jgi:hypothetical protein